MDKKTKDYIYLDDDLLNSHLAQFEKGLLTRETSEQGFESSDSSSGSSKVVSGIDGFLGIGAKLQSEISEGDSNVESEFTKKMVENVLNDYAVDLLIENCNHNDLISELNVSSEGDFVLFRSHFKIYDFEYIKSITDPQNISAILEQGAPPSQPSSQANKQERTEYHKQLALYKKTTSNASEAYQSINVFSTFASVLFDDSILLKTNNSLSICKRKKLRLSKAQSSFENETVREITVFGVVSTTKSKTHPNGSFGPFNTDDLDKVSSLLFDITLSNFNILSSGDKIIKPIAIYFEAD